MASMWLQEAAQTMNIDIALGNKMATSCPMAVFPHGHQYVSTRTSIWPQTSTWAPVAAQTMEIHMNLKLNLVWGSSTDHG